MGPRAGFLGTALPLLGVVAALSGGCSGDDSSTAGGSSTGGSQGETGGTGSTGGSGGTAGTGGNASTGGSAATGGGSVGGNASTGGSGGVGTPEDASDDVAMTPTPDAGGTPTGGRLSCGDALATDWGTAMVAATMTRNPNPLDWEYSQALFLHGAYLVYKRTQDPKILAYIKAWADARIGDSTSNAYDSVDSMMPNTVLLDVYEETKDMKYGQGAARMRNRFKTYPRTSDGAFWHSTGAIDQNWGDTVFMGQPTLERYGHLFNDATYTDDETSKQLLLFHDHLKNPNGLHWHAWAECRTNCPTWTDKTTHHSPESWGRANGWFVVATMMILDLLPPGHANRAPLIEVLKGLVDGIKKWQDPATGRWFQLVDKGTDAANWLETSSSSMYTYVVAKAIRLGYVDASYADVAVKGFQGVLKQISLDGGGMTNLTEICRGTNVGDAAYYYARPRPVNDMHGLGSFLIMYEELRQDCQ